jgi:alpha-N-arabinofuranosidase
MVGGALITLLNNSDRVKAACLAQLVNVIGAIFTEPGGTAWRQTIFHPFKLVAQNARGKVLETKVQSTQFETKTAGTIDHIVASSVHDANQRKVVLFVLNREASDSVDLSIELRAFPQIKG